MLKAIRARPDVQDVLVEIIGIDGTWPDAGAIYVLTSAPHDVRETWAERLRADGAMEVAPTEPHPPGMPELRGGFLLVRLAWD